MQNLRLTKAWASPRKLRAEYSRRIRRGVLVTNGTPEFCFDKPELAGQRVTRSAVAVGLPEMHEANDLFSTIVIALMAFTSGAGLLFILWMWGAR